MVALRIGSRASSWPGHPAFFSGHCCATRNLIYLLHRTSVRLAVGGSRVFALVGTENR